MSSALGQNLVPNSSFENFTSCPVGPGCLWLAPPWFQPNYINGINYTSSDYYNQCAPYGLVSVPANTYSGAQVPRTGNAYVGIYTYLEPNRREYIEDSLTIPLIAGHTYCVTYYVSLFDSCQYGSSSLGAYFSTDSLLYSSSTFAPIQVIPQVENPDTNIITDKNNWTLISGSFLALGGERFITIGNFRNDVNTIKQNVGGGAQLGAGFYFDDISVVDCTGLGVGELGNKVDLKLYPNPSNGNMVLEYNIGEHQNGVLTIFDVTGKLIDSNSFNGSANNSTINASQLDAGIYFYEINIDGNKIKTDKLVIIK